MRLVLVKVLKPIHPQIFSLKKTGILISFWNTRVPVT